MATQGCPSCGAPVGAEDRFCATCGTPLAAPAQEERKLATILFADVIGSTDLGEQLDPERLRALLQEYFGAMSRVIQEWGGTVEKYIGDAILAVFGVPTAREDDAVRALQAATEMLAALERVNAGFEDRHGVRVAVRIGVNTGEVLAPVGASPAGQFLVSGDAVNVAARLEQAADPGTVLVGDRTWSAARDAFAFDDPVELSLKGKRDVVVARRLGEPLGAQAGRVRLEAPMVGRDRELDTLIGLLEEAVETEVPRLVVLSGPAGIGKSRMLREFVLQGRQRHEDLALLRGRCLAAGHGITFWALGEVLRQAAGISLDESGESAAEKLRDSARALLAPLGLTDSDLDETVYALATTANIAIAGNPLEGLAPEAVAEEMARAWARFLTALATRAPTAILVEDIHWADERMVAMLELLASRSRGRLILIATARPEFIESHPGFGAGDVTVVSLRPLTEAQSERLVAELLGDSDPLQALLADVREKAEGNPFFLEEIIQRLIDEGALVREDGRWRATERAATVRLPDTIHALLAARIDALPPQEKTVLQQAAVVGRIFWPGSLTSSTSQAGVSVNDELRALERKGLVTVRPISTIHGEPEYTFRHVLIRDVAYASVPKARRAVAHAETGRWIEALAGDRLEEFGELLAYHYAAAAAGEDADLAWAGDPSGREEIRRRAFEVLLRAGGAARHRFAVEKSLELHKRALEISADDAERSRAHEAIGDDHEALFHMDEAVASYFAALEAAQAAGQEAAVLSRLAIRLGRATMRWGAFRQKPDANRIRALLDRALASEQDLRARAGLLIARSAVWRGADDELGSRDPLSIDEAIAAVEDGLDIARQLDDVELMEWGEQILGGRAYVAHDHAKERAAVERLAALVDRLPTRREKTEALEALAESRWEEGRFREALETAERALDLASEVSEHERMHASGTLMHAALALGEWDRVAELVQWHVAAANRDPDVGCGNVRAGPFLGATVMALRGEIEQARDLVPPEATEAARVSYFARRNLARYAALVGRTDVANQLTDELVADTRGDDIADGFEAFLDALEGLGRHDDLARELPAARALVGASEVLAPVADRAEAKLALDEGRAADARPLLESALRRFEELQMPYEAARTRELLAETAGRDERIALLGDAWATYERLGAKPSVDRVRERLSSVAATA
jgi:class 3 adenylate cyclase/tetratricopeptide (TPR) repeat protein